MNMDSPSPMLQARAAPAATPLLPVAYRVFISHGAVDRAPVNRIVGACRDAGVEPYIYEHDQRPGQSVAEKVQQQIRSSDAVIVLLSKQSATSAYVQQEIGYALAQRKPVLPLVEQGIGEETLAMLKGVEWVAFDRTDPDQALHAIGSEVARLRAQKQYRQDVVLMIALVAGLLVATYLIAQAE